MIALALTWGALYEDVGTPVVDGRPNWGSGSAIALNQGWTEERLDAFGSVDIGSRLIPLDWLQHLARAGGDEPFLDAEHMQQLGFQVQQPTPANPDGLPLGFSHAIDGEGTSWVGVTCAACHSGVLQYRGAQIRLAGGSGRLDLARFEHELIAALNETIDSPRKWQAFASTIAGNGKASLPEVRALRDRLARRALANSSQTAYGPGRTDAFGQIFNAVTAELLRNPDNARPVDAPVSIPVLWGAPRLNLVQWNASSPNNGPAPFFQNLVTAIAVYGQIDLEHPTVTGGYPSSIAINNLGRLQTWLVELQPPKWPIALFGSIDEARLGRGADIYQDQCQRCHGPAHVAPGDPMTAKAIPIAEVGTDPRMSDNFEAALAESGQLTGRKLGVIAGDPIPARARSLELVTHVAIGAALAHPFETLRAARRSYHSMGTPELPSQPSYIARPLLAIWASPPYLHNGSVPNLYQLLLPADARVTAFHVANAEYDTLRAGYADQLPERVSSEAVFDTGLPGNSNAGHEFGTQLSESERLDLLEFLKSL